MRPPGTSTDDSWLAQQINRCRALIGDEAIMDMDRWGIHPKFKHMPEQVLDVLLPSDEITSNGFSRVWISGRLRMATAFIPVKMWIN